MHVKRHELRVLYGSTRSFPDTLGWLVSRMPHSIGETFKDNKHHQQHDTAVEDRKSSDSYRNDSIPTIYCNLHSMYIHLLKHKGMVEPKLKSTDRQS
jgi:hypothetical protein